MLITMFHELCVPLTIKIMALGHSLYEAQRMAAVIVLQVVVLCMMMGYRVVLPDEMSRADCPVYLIAGRAGSVPCMGTCGIFPADTGTAADSNRALLFTQ
jgi:hypothetical protein